MHSSPHKVPHIIFKSIQSPGNEAGEYPMTLHRLSLERRHTSEHCQKGTTPVSKIKDGKIYRFHKEMVFIRVSGPAKSKFGLF